MKTKHTNNSRKIIKTIFISLFAAWFLLTLGLFLYHHPDRELAMERVNNDPELIRLLSDPNFAILAGVTGVGTFNYFLYNLLIGFAILIICYLIVVNFYRVIEKIRNPKTFFPSALYLNPYLIILSGSVLCATIFLWVHKVELLPNFWTACGTLFFAYFAYIHTKEKFRLELLAQREMVYEAVHEFGLRASALSLVYDNILDTKTLDMREYAKNLTDICGDLKAKINEVKIKRLFGSDVVIYYSQLSDCFSKVYGDVTLWDLDISNKDELELVTNIKSLMNQISKIDAVFLPYLYFGQYKL